MPEPERYLVDAHAAILPPDLEQCPHRTSAVTVRGTGSMGFLDRWDLITYADGCTHAVGSPSTTTTT